MMSSDTRAKQSEAALLPKQDDGSDTDHLIQTGTNKLQNLWETFLI